MCLAGRLIGGAVRMRRFIAALSCLVAVLSCGGEAPEVPSGEVVLHEITRSALDSLSVTTFDTVFITNIASAPSPLHMVSGAALLPGGGLAVASRGTSEVQFFDGSGTFVRAAGRQGDGPGEFRAVIGVWTLPDERILTWDPVLRRSSYWNTQGDLVAEETYEAEYLNPPRVVGLVRSGFVLVHERFESPEARGRFADMPADYVLVPFDGSRPDTLGQFPWRRLARGEEPIRGVMSRLFDGVGHGVAAGDHFWFGHGARPVLTRFALDGTPELEVRWATEDRSLTSEDVEAWKDRAEVGASGDRQSNRRWAEAVVDQFGVADSFPAFDRLLADSDERVWSRFSPPLNRTGEAEWLVLDSRGLPVWRFAADKSLRVLDARDDLVALLLEDELGVERVAVGRIRH